MMRQSAAAAAMATGLLCSSWSVAAELSQEPAIRTPSACTTWANKQSDDVLELWGTDENGTISHDLAMSRLISSCLDNKPATQAAAPVCVVDDPTPTPLNYRTGPNGQILGAFQNGVSVQIIDHTTDARGQPWVYVAGTNGRPFGWVFRRYIDCR